MLIPSSLIRLTRQWQSLLKLSKFPAGQSSFDQLFLRSPRYTLSRISISILGSARKRDLSDCAKLLAPRLFDGYRNHISTRVLLKELEPLSAVGSDKSFLFSGLHCASIFVIVEIVASLVGVKVVMSIKKTV